MATRELVAFILGGAGGFALWLFSQSLTGDREPWDGNVLLYLFALLVIGLVLLLVLRSRLWTPYLGVVAGQVLFGLMPFMACLFGYDCENAGNLFPLGVVALGIYSLPTLLGSLLAQWLRRT